MSLDYIDPSSPPPVDWNGPIFPEPMLYRLAPLWLFLLLLAVLALLFYRQRLLGERTDGRRAPSIIYNEVRKAINNALYATGPATIPAGQKVLETIRLYLGPVLAFAADLKGPITKLEAAVAGRVEDDEHYGRHSHRKPLVVEEKTCAPLIVQPGEGVITAEKVIQVIGPAQVITVTEPARPVEPDVCGVRRDEVMSLNDQIASVRYALERLHEFWTANAVEPRLKEMYDALSIREPRGVRRLEGARRWDGAAPRGPRPRL